MCETEIRVEDGVCRLRREETRWLSTGYSGGFADAPAAYNVSVPTGWERTDIDAYAAERRADAGFREDGPTLLTGVAMDHARVARAGSVTVVATAGVSNPAALPMDPAADEEAVRPESSRADAATDAAADHGADPGRGTVNVLVATDRRLADGGLANLVAIAVEAKAATLLSTTGFPGTTTDAVIAGSARDGERATFSGSATSVGDAARACVRDAVLASLDSRYDAGDATIPDSVADAEYGVVTDRETEVFAP